ncbi:MAG: hypothetical protein ACRDK4_14635, partial [Solirubrobacteraceae bacterium]
MSVPIEWNETAVDLQAKLEAVADIGVGNVEVSGGPGDETGSKPYVVRFVGALSGSSQRLLLQKSLLTGGEHTIRRDEALSVKAAAYDRYTVTATNIGNRVTVGPIELTETVPSPLVVVAAEVEARPSEVTAACPVAQTVTCEFNGQVSPGGKLVMTVEVALRSFVYSGTLADEVAVSGG